MNLKEFLRKWLEPIDDGERQAFNKDLEEIEDFEDVLDYYRKRLDKIIEPIEE